MAQIAFFCGHCKTTTIGHAEALRQFPAKEDWLRSELSVSCNQCFRLSILYFTCLTGTGWADEDDKHHLLQSEFEAGAAITVQPSSQFPSLVRGMPQGCPFDLWKAWKEAENAYSRNDMPTLATIAYRRVLESAAKILDKADDNDKSPLGNRLKKLRDNNTISEELYELTNRALQFGNAAAHEAKPLTETDARVARDLADAFLRQVFSIPKLLEDAETALEKRKELEEKIPGLD